MTTDPTDRAAMVERLSRHERLRGVPRTELEWLAAHGQPCALAPGDVVAHMGDSRESLHLYIVLSGRLTTYVQRQRARRKLREVRGGELVGLLPFSRLTISTADVVVDDAAEVLRIDSGLFPALIRECPAVAAACVHSMIDRAQALTESQLHDEKMFSLGKLAAGLAHELNNPASAALRSVESLVVRQREIDDASDAVAISGLSASQQETLRALREECLIGARSHESPIARADREEAIAQWLEAHDIDPVPAATLADACVTIERLETLAGTISGPALGPAISWVAASIGGTALLSEIRQAVKRIHDLIAAVKGFTQMDRPLVPEPMSIAPGVRDTVSVMGPKARERSVTIDIDVPEELPLVRASAADLNQVWASLLDNALDAAPTASRVQISARTVERNVVVSVVDQGAGVPQSIRGQIFDPFFTTKPVGQGRGLGLDTARRIVSLIEGQIELDSVVGRTEFRVHLPIAMSGARP